MPNYHVVMMDGSERNIRAATVSQDEGVLVFATEEDQPKVAIAPGQWKYVELESQDDRG